MEDILTIVFAIAVLGHGLAHAAASFNLGRQLVGRPRKGALEARTPLLASRSAAASAALGLVFWLPATVGFVIAAPAMMDLCLTDLPWSSMLVAAALISIGGMALFTGV